MKLPVLFYLGGRKDLKQNSINQGHKNNYFLKLSSSKKEKKEDKNRLKDWNKESRTDINSGA